MAVLAVAGCGDDDDGDGTTAAPATTTPTLTGPAAGKSSTQPIAPGGTNAGPTTTYTGDGAQRLPLKLERSAVLRWTVSGTRFRLSEPRGRLKVSGGARGQTFVPAGNYPRARVSADGKWRLRVQLLDAPK